MEILALSLTGIYWNEHGWNGKGELTVHGDLIGFNSPVTLKFEEIDRPTDVQRMFDAFTFKKRVKLVTETAFEKETEPPKSNKNSSEEETLADKVREKFNADMAKKQEESTSEHVESVDKSVSSEHLQSVASEADFDPEAVGEATAARVTTPTSAVAAVTGNVESIDYRKPGNFSPTDFDQANAQTQAQQEQVYGADGQKVASEGGFPM